MESKVADQDTKDFFDNVMDDLREEFVELSIEVTDMKVKLMDLEEKGEVCMLYPEKHYDNKTYHEMENLKDNIETHKVKIHFLKNIRDNIFKSFIKMSPEKTVMNVLDVNETVRCVMKTVTAM